MKEKINYLWGMLALSATFCFWQVFAYYNPPSLLSQCTQIVEIGGKYSIEMGDVFCLLDEKEEVIATIRLASIDHESFDETHFFLDSTAYPEEISRSSVMPLDGTGRLHFVPEAKLTILMARETPTGESFYISLSEYKP